MSAHAFAEHGQKFLVTDKAPALLERRKESRRNLTCKAVYVNVRPETAYEICHEIQILFQRELVEIFPVLGKLLLHPGAADDLQAVLPLRQRKAAQRGQIADQVSCAVVWRGEDEVHGGGLAGGRSVILYI